MACESVPILAWQSSGVQHSWQCPLQQTCPTAQSLLQFATGTQPCSALHTSVLAQSESSGMFLHPSLVQLSLVHSTSSLQSLAAQHWPQLAPVSVAQHLLSVQ